MDISQIERYELLQKIYSDNSFSIYQGRNKDTGKPLIVRDNGTLGKSLDSKIVERLHHQNIAHVFRAGETTEGRAFIVSELVEGKPLSEILQNGKKIEVLKSLHYLAQVAGALDYAHSQTISHVAITPSVIVVSDEGKATILGFGIGGDAGLQKKDREDFTLLAYLLLCGAKYKVGEGLNIEDIKERFDVGEAQALHFSELFLKRLGSSRELCAKSSLEFIYDIAKTFSILIDGSGVIGYRDNITIRDIVKREMREAEVVAGDVLSVEATAEMPKAVSPSSSDTSLTSTGVAEKTATPPSKPMDTELAKVKKIDTELKQLHGKLASNTTSKKIERVLPSIISIFCVLCGVASVFFYMRPLEGKEKPNETVASAQNDPKVMVSNSGVSTVADTKEERQITIVSTADVEKRLKSGDLTTASDLLNLFAVDKEDAVVNEFILKLIKNDDVDIRIGSLRVLIGFQRAKNKTVVGAVMDSLNDAEPSVRIAAGEFFASFGSPAAKKILEKHLTVETDKTVAAAFSRLIL